MAFYRNWKTGDLYEVTGESEFEEDHDTLIEYREVSTGKKWSRRKSIFFETLTRGNYTGPRFVQVPILNLVCMNCGRNQCYQSGAGHKWAEYTCLGCMYTWPE